MLQPLRPLLASACAILLLWGCAASRAAAPEPVEVAGLEAGARAAAGHRQAGYERVGGAWVSSGERAVLAAGGARVGGELVAAADLAAARAGRFRCGGALLAAGDADDFHSRTGHGWRLELGGFRVISTCSRATTLEALEAMAAAEGHLERLFGARPARPATVVLLRSVEQYNAFALIGPELGRVASAARDFSAYHHAFPAEAWVDLEGGGVFPGAAAAYWDAGTEAGRAWGPFAARSAAGLAFAEALDPSPVAVGARLADPHGSFESGAFWSEKELPLWLRYGAASYVERWAPDGESEDPGWAARWSAGELERAGGLPPLDALFAFRASGADVEQAARLVLAAGRVVAELLDYGDPELAEAHARFAAAVAAGAGVGQAVAGLERSLRERFEPPAVSSP